MSSLVNKLRGVGRLHAQGEFTLDQAKAGSKLSRFQFRHPREFLCHMVAGLYRLGAQSVSVSHEDAYLSIKIEPIALADDLPATLDLHLLEEESPLRRLAAASQSVLSLELKRFEWIGCAKNQSYDYLTDKANNWNRVQLQAIHFDGIEPRLLKQAVEELKAQALYNRRRLLIQDRPVSTSLVTGWIGPWTGQAKCDLQATRSQVILVVDEMVTEAKPLETDIPWAGVVYWEGHQVRLDASLASVVEGPEYARLLQEIPKTFSGCCRALLQQGIQNRDFFLERLRRPAPHWLHSIYDEVCHQNWFPDQVGKKFSLASLMRLQQPIYYTSSLPPEGLSEVILQHPGQSALLCLQIHLGERLQEATPLVLRQLQRKANLARWQSQPEEGLSLPTRTYLLKKTYPRWVIGLPDDWSQPGGMVTARYQGKFLIRLPIRHEEISFEVACELQEDEISELWDNLASSAWGQLEPQWLYCVDEMLKELVSSHLDLASIRPQLLEHLSRQRHPEDSYFSRTLLFQDWHGKPYSIRSLLEARAQGQRIGYMARSRKAEDYPQKLLPDLIYLLAGPVEWKCLSQVPALGLIHLNPLLDDLSKARLSPPVPLNGPWVVAWEGEGYRARLEIIDEWGQGLVQLHTGELDLGCATVKSSIGYLAQVIAPDLEVKVRLDAVPLGEKRFEIASSAVWKRCQEALSEKVRESVQRRLAGPEGPELLTWASKCLLRGLRDEFPQLADVKCLQAFPERLSLAQAEAASHIYHTADIPERSAREEFLKQHPGGVLLAGLEPALATSLLARAQCVDDWFAEKARLKEFLRKPPVTLGFRGSLASSQAEPPLQGMISLLGVQSGMIQWLYRGRLLEEDDLTSHPGLRAQVECPDLEPTENFDGVKKGAKRQKTRQEVVQQMTALLVSWLSQPRPSSQQQFAHWRHWEGLGPEVQEGLRRQPWFETNQGDRSWQQLLEHRPVYRSKYPLSEPPEDLLMLYEHMIPERILNSLAKAHPEMLSLEATGKFLAKRRQEIERRQTLERQARRLEKQAYKVDLPQPLAGQLALVPKKIRDCWLVLPGETLPIENLPHGLMGYVDTDRYKQVKIGSKRYASLQSSECHRIYRALVPVFLERLKKGSLDSVEVENLAEFCLECLSLAHPPDPQDPWASLAQARWIPCADGTLTSLQQLRLQAQEQKQLAYWPKAFWLAGGAHMMPILTSPLQIELVRRWTEVSPEEHRPLLYQDITQLGGVRKLLQSLASWVRSRPGSNLTQGIKGMVQQRMQQVQHYQRAQEQKKRAQEQKNQAAKEKAEETRQQMGKGLLTAVRRHASSLLQGTARKEALALLEKARWSDNSSKTMWQFGPQELVLFSRHAQLQPWLSDNEPPPPVVLSLLLGLVSAINTRSLPFTDSMEQEFLERLTHDVVDTYRDRIK